MAETNKNTEILKKDILRYKSNKIAFTFAILGIIFNCLYFTIFYSVNNTFFYTLEIGISVILTLLVLLLTFYSSVGVKGYVKQFSYVLWVIAAVQIIRLVLGPILASQGVNWFRTEVYETGVMKTRYFGMDLDNTACCIIMVIYLAISAGCLITSGVFGYIRAVQLEKFNKQIENGEINVDAVLKELDEEDEKAVASVRPVAEITKEVE